MLKLFRTFVCGGATAAAALSSSVNCDGGSLFTVVAGAVVLLAVCGCEIDRPVASPSFTVKLRKQLLSSGGCALDGRNG